jgi:hypothetical protein
MCEKKAGAKYRAMCLWLKARVKAAEARRRRELRVRQAAERESPRETQLNCVWPWSMSACGGKREASARARRRCRGRALGGRGAATQAKAMAGRRKEASDRRTVQRIASLLSADS